ncbi:MAG: DNA glycosylase [Puniceicoccales bacterium]
MSPHAIEWSPWQPVEPAVNCTPDALAELLDGGQAFRWNLEDDNIWRGVWGICVAELRAEDERIHWRAPVLIANRVAAEIASYLGPDEDFAAAWDSLPWRSDPVLHAAMSRWRGLRIMRQTFGETVLCFLCSSMKQITHIKQITETLAARFGEELAPGIHALPSWNRLHRVPEAELRNCGLGYRARYIHATTHFLAGQPGWLDVVENLPYPDAFARLKELPGVGSKIADCALLFGAAKLEAFPVDTWIARIMAERYGLQGWSIEQVAHFGRTHFGAHAGLAQQFLFSDARRG